MKKALFFLIFIQVQAAWAQKIIKINSSRIMITDPAVKDTGYYNRVTRYIDGSMLTAAKCDDVIYKKIGQVYYKREIKGNIKTDWFTGTPSVKEPVNAAIKAANSMNLPVLVSANISEYVKVAPKAGFTGNGIISYKDAIIYKPGLQYIGIPQNINEQAYKYPKLITDGGLIPAPLATKKSKRPVTILAHWFNDFGLNRTALSKNSAKGSAVWYDWSWNFTTSANYDPARHPLLGWYRGDDPLVLNWICYWLVKYNVDGVILANMFSTENWSRPDDKSYWYYQLFNHAPNFKQLNYSVWLAANHGISVQKAEKHDSDMVNNILRKYPNVNCYTINNKRYPIFYAWDMEGFRGTYDHYNGLTNSVKHLKALAAMCKAVGYDGICVYARNFSTKLWTFNPIVLNGLEDAGVYMFSQNYSTMYTKSSAAAYNNLYKNYADKVDFPDDDNEILNVITAGYTKKPHPSNWKLQGSTPKLFKQALQKAINVTLNSGKPKTVVIYNVSEWAEAGPGLIPNQRDYFGYLEAVSSISMQKTH